MSKGKVENFDTPYNLLKDKSSILYELISSLELPEKNNLIKIAKYHDSKRKSSDSLKMKNDMEEVYSDDDDRNTDQYEQQSLLQK